MVPPYGAESVTNGFLGAREGGGATYTSGMVVVGGQHLWGIKQSSVWESCNSHLPTQLPSLGEPDNRKKKSDRMDSNRSGWDTYLSIDCFFFSSIHSFIHSLIYSLIRSQEREILEKQKTR